MPAKPNPINWYKSCIGAAWFAYVRSCKVVELSIGYYVVERITATAHEPLGTFATLAEALTAVEGEPEATCFGCGRTVAPGYQWLDLNCPDWK